MISLVLPSEKYRESYVEAVKEFHSVGNENAEYYGELDPVKLSDPVVFSAYVLRLHEQIEGIGLPEGYVPATEFWIITESGEYAGRVHIRHRLTDYLLKAGGHIGYNIRPSMRGKGYGSEALRLGLEEARKMGFERVLLTCNSDNEPSRKIIEKNGGVYENAVTDGTVLKRRYWITL